MRVNGRSSRDNLIQVKIKGRSQSTDRSKENNTVYNMGKSEPIRYPMEELRLIKRKVESNDKYRRLGIKVCYMIRKLRLNRQLRKKNIHEVKEERGILRSKSNRFKTRKKPRHGHDKQKVHNNTEQCPIDKKQAGCNNGALRRSKCRSCSINRNLAD